MVDSDGDSMDATLNTTAARLSAFQKNVERQFVQFGEQFDQVNKRFSVVDQHFEQVDRRFERIEAVIRSEGKRTRRHFRRGCGADESGTKPRTRPRRRERGESRQALCCERYRT